MPGATRGAAHELSGHTVSSEPRSCLTPYLGPACGILIANIPEVHSMITELED